MTKSIRHLDPSKFNFLDMTSTTIAGSGGNISAAGGSSEYLVGNNTLTNTVSSGSTSLKAGMPRAHSSYTPPRAPALGRQASEYGPGNAGDHVAEGTNIAGRYIKNVRKSFKYSKSNDGSDSNGGLKAAYDYNNSILKEHFRNIDIKADQMSQVNAQNNQFDRDTYDNNLDIDPNEEEDEVSEDSECESEEEEVEQQNEYPPKPSRASYSPGQVDSHNYGHSSSLDHKFNPNHCNECMQKYIEQQLIAKNYEHQQQSMSRDYSSQEDILSSLRGVSPFRISKALKFPHLSI